MIDLTNILGKNENHLIEANYQEDRVMVGVTRWKDRITSTSGDSRSSVLVNVPVAV